MLIYLLRHGETDWNAEHRMQGQSDIPLNAEGMKQAQLAANRLKNVPFDAIYSSPLIRAKMTAEQVAYGRKLPVLIDERLTEINFGVLEGCPRGSHPMAYTYYHDPVHYIPCEGGESYEDLEKRCSDVWENLLVPLEGIFQTVLVSVWSWRMDQRFSLLFKKSATRRFLDRPSKAKRRVYFDRLSRWTS